MSGKWIYTAHPPRGRRRHRCKPPTRRPRNRQIALGDQWKCGRCGRVWVVAYMNADRIGWQR